MESGDFQLADHTEDRVRPTRTPQAIIAMVTLPADAVRGVLRFAGLWFVGVVWMCIVCVCVFVCSCVHAFVCAYACSSLFLFTCVCVRIFMFALTALLLADPRQ